MALTEYKVDRVRSRATSCNGLDRWIYDDILEGIDNVATLICLDDPHIRFSDAVRRTKSTQARTRGVAAMVYGDFEVCLVEVMAKPARRWSRWDIGEWDFLPDGAGSGIWLRLICSAFGLILVKSVDWRIRHNGGVAA